MSTLALIGLGALAFILIIGIIRVVFRPSASFMDFFLEILLIDLLIDLLGFVFEIIGEILGDL